MIMKLAPLGHRFHSSSADQFHDRSGEQSKIQNVSNLHRKIVFSFDETLAILRRSIAATTVRFCHSLGDTSA